LLESIPRVTNAQFRAFGAGDELSDLGEIAPEPKTIPARCPKMLKAGGAGVHAPDQACRPRRLQPVVALHLPAPHGGGHYGKGSHVGG